MQASPIKATTAAELINDNIQALPHPDSGVLRLTMFSHQSETARKYKRQISEALVLLLENNGYHVCNGLSEAVALLELAGYTVTAAESSEDEPTAAVDAPSLADLEPSAEHHP